MGGGRVRGGVRRRNPVPFRTMNHISETAISPISRDACALFGRREQGDIEEWEIHCSFAILVYNVKNVDEGGTSTENIAISKIPKYNLRVFRARVISGFSIHSVREFVPYMKVDLEGRKQPNP